VYLVAFKSGIEWAKQAKELANIEILSKPSSDDNEEVRLIMLKRGRIRLAK